VPEATICQYTWNTAFQGAQSHVWMYNDCSHGLPGSDWASIGEGENVPLATQPANVGQVACTPTTGTMTNPANAKGTVKCLFTRRPPPTSCQFDQDQTDVKSFDLDGDGRKDSEIVGFVPCGDWSGSLSTYQPCVRVDTCLFAPPVACNVGTCNDGKQTLMFQLPATPGVPTPVPDPNVPFNAPTPNVGPYVNNYHPRPIGDLTGDGLQELAIPYTIGIGTANQRVGLAVLDLDPLPNPANSPASTTMHRAILGNTASPTSPLSPATVVTTDGTYLFADILYPTDGAGHAYPFLVSGYQDSAQDPTIPPQNQRPTWGFGCLFRFDPTGTVQYPYMNDTNTQECNFEPGGPPPPQTFVKVDFSALGATGAQMTADNILSGQAVNYSRWAQVWSREVGGYVQDMDGDGWDDLNILFHYQTLTVSGQTGRLVHDAQTNTTSAVATWAPTDTFYDPYSSWCFSTTNQLGSCMQSAPPAYTAWNIGPADGGAPTPPNINFHSGRQYGVHSSKGGGRTVIVSGGTVGEFGYNPKGEPEIGDGDCGVSRWIGVLDSFAQSAPAGTAPFGNQLTWSKYFSYSNNIPNLSTNWQSFAGDGGAATCAQDAFEWTGDFLDRCIHTFSNATSVASGLDVIVYNQFHETSTSWLNGDTNCMLAQCDYEIFGLPNGQVQGSPIETCKDSQTAFATGTWAANVLSANGPSSTAPGSVLANSYVWGWADGVWPGQTVYFVEPTDATGNSKFNALGTAPPQKPINLMTLTGSLGSTSASFAFGPLASLPVGSQVRPYINRFPVLPGSVGTDNVTPSALSLQDIDGDGYLDVMFQVPPSQWPSAGWPQSTTDPSDGAPPPSPMCVWYGWRWQDGTFAQKSQIPFACYGYPYYDDGAVDTACTPSAGSCVGAQCGVVSNGCGTVSCGECPVGQECIGNQCSAPVHGCASGSSDTVFAPGMAACPGTVTWANAASLCGSSYHVCSAWEWASNKGPTAPVNNYWVSDNLGYGGTSSACYASTTNEGNCGSGDPMRVCGRRQDAQGNRCNWVNCGLNGPTANYYFGGCVGDATAGTLCCIDSTPTPQCVPSVNPTTGQQNPPQSFGAGMFGCPGNETWDQRAALCGVGCSPCTAAQWVQYSLNITPLFDYWTDDDLQYAGSASSCVADQSSYTNSFSCGMTNGIPTPMRVCVPQTTDSTGNVCNWYGCGYDEDYTGANFGGCVGDTTAGTLCCCGK
jgi:hypothetical protein